MNTIIKAGSDQNWKKNNMVIACNFNMNCNFNALTVLIKTLAKILMNSYPQKRFIIYFPICRF